MTTIAYCNGVMACDSCWTGDDGDLQEVSHTKITRLQSGGLLGQSGANDARELEALLDKVKDVKNLPSRKDLIDIRLDFAGILVLPSGLVYKVVTVADRRDGGDAGIWPCNRGMIACGSGGHLALGFMGAGGSPKDAVNFACKWDINSRPPVHVVELRPVAKGGQSKQASKKGKRIK